MPDQPMLADVIKPMDMFQQLQTDKQAASKQAGSLMDALAPMADRLRDAVQAQQDLTPQVTSAQDSLLNVLTEAQPQIENAYQNIVRTKSNPRIVGKVMGIFDSNWNVEAQQARIAEQQGRVTNAATKVEALQQALNSTTAQVGQALQAGMSIEQAAQARANNTLSVIQAVPTILQTQHALQAERIAGMSDAELQRASRGGGLIAQQAASDELNRRSMASMAIREADLGLQAREMDVANAALGRFLQSQTLGQLQALKQELGAGGSKKIGKLATVTAADVDAALSAKGAQMRQQSEVMAEDAAKNAALRPTAEGIINSFAVAKQANLAMPPGMESQITTAMQAASEAAQYSPTKAFEIVDKLRQDVDKQIETSLKDQPEHRRQTIRELMAGQRLTPTTAADYLSGELTLGNNLFPNGDQFNAALAPLVAQYNDALKRANPLTRSPILDKNGKQTIDIGELILPGGQRVKRSELFSTILAQNNGAEKFRSQVVFPKYMETVMKNLAQQQPAMYAKYYDEKTGSWSRMLYDNNPTSPNFGKIEWVKLIRDMAAQDYALEAAGKPAAYLPTLKTAWRDVGVAKQFQTSFDTEYSTPQHQAVISALTANRPLDGILGWVDNFDRWALDVPQQIQRAQTEQAVFMGGAAGQNPDYTPDPVTAIRKMYGMEIK